MARRHGYGYWDRSVNTNDTDFFSTEPLQDISGVMFLSCVEDKHIYGFDIRSIHSLYARVQPHELPINPYTRASFPPQFEQVVKDRISWLKRHNFPTEWVPLQPPTPEQQWRMKVVDLFHRIDELNYYSSPDWFIGLNLYGHQKFYRELYDIWFHRTGLSSEEKTRIVPTHATRLFQVPPINELPIESYRKLNMGTIRLFLSAEDRNDQIVGAMYVVSALTLVNRQARTAYPWLYESIAEEAVPWFLSPMFLMDTIPLLQLDPGL